MCKHVNVHKDKKGKGHYLEENYLKKISEMIMCLKNTIDQKLLKVSISFN